MFSAGPRGLDLCTKAVMPKVRGYLMPQTQILSFTVLPTAPPPSRCQFASLYQGFPFRVAFWIKAAVGSIQGSRFRHCGSVRVQRSLPASRSPRTTEKTAMWSFKPVSKGTLLKFRFSQDWLLLWVTTGTYWAEGRLNFSQAPSAVSGSPRITQPCILRLCFVIWWENLSLLCLLGLLLLPHHLQ